MKNRIIILVTFITLSIVLIWGIIVVNERYPDDRKFWKNEVTYMCPHDSVITCYMPYMDSLNDLVVIHYKSEGDEFYKYDKTLFIIRSPNNSRMIYYNRENNQADRKLSIVHCDSIFDSRYIDSLFTLLSKDILSLRSLYSGTCFGCETYRAYSRVNRSENAISWETDDLKFIDFRYKKLNQLFQNAMKECDLRKTEK